MPINVKGLFETLQYKANNIDSSTSTAEILDTLKAIKLADGNTIISYDSDGALPDATTTNIKLAYVKSAGIIKFNNGTWDTLTGSLDGAAAAGLVAQGSVASYTSGGSVPPGSNIIDKIPFSTDGNATDVGDLLSGVYAATGIRSTTHGYVAGGATPSYSNVIQKFSFSVDENSTDVGDLTVTSYTSAAAESTTHGYVSGGETPSRINVIQKFSLVADANATDVGDLTDDRSELGGNGSTTHGYVAGGNAFPGPDAQHSMIEKFPFSTDGNATDVADLSSARYGNSGSNSETDGYSAGGRAHPGGAQLNSIDKYPFATDANGTDIADITLARAQGAGTSSTTHGYTSAGYNPAIGSPNRSNTVDKFPFSTDENATDVGDLTSARWAPAGQES
jgi:hypothetical protein